MLQRIRRASSGSASRCFTFLRGHDLIRCDLRDHSAYGVEANGRYEIAFAAPFDQEKPRPTVTPQDLAAQASGTLQQFLRNLGVGTDAATAEISRSP